MAEQILYIFIDESGNYDFSDSGTEFLVISAISTLNPIAGIVEADQLRHEINCSPAEYDCDGIEYFHAAEDKQKVRDAYLNVVVSNFEFIADILYVKKRKTYPTIQSMAALITKMIPCLFDYIINNPNHKNIDKFIIYTDKLSSSKQKRMLEKSLKSAIRSRVGTAIPFEIHHVASSSQAYLQAVDYACWAAQRRLERNDRRSYELLRSNVHSFYDFFGWGDTEYY